jgi:hypothetical protein
MSKITITIEETPQGVDIKTEGFPEGFVSPQSQQEFDALPSAHRLAIIVLTTMERYATPLPQNEDADECAAPDACCGGSCHSDSAASEN